MAPARNGASAVITGLDIAYEERETRSFVRLTLMSLAITAFGVFVAIVALIAIAALGHLGDLLSGAPWIFGKRCSAPTL
ncbi:MAG: ribonuclease [Sphingomonas bacterium]|nr:ribonuclease [Sphingomonas bacterium]